jgi:hypothetical protein
MVLQHCIACSGVDMPRQSNPYIARATLSADERTKLKGRSENMDPLTTNPSKSYSRLLPTGHVIFTTGYLFERTGSPKLRWRPEGFSVIAALPS